jgi:lantibiotic modifying enzyme
VGLSADAMRLGGCDGLGSVVYALSWMGRLLADDGCIELAARVASHITTIRIDADQRLDVHGGAAGAILALLAHYDVTGDTDALERARACGRHLVDRMVPTDDGSAWPAVNGQRLAGLAHGAAGVSYALLCLGRETLDLEFVRAAEEGYRFERSVFSGAHRNWPTVGRAGQTLSEAPIMMNAWCHGAPGIALARVLALDMIADSDVVSEIVTGVATTGAASESVDHLCCGQLGRCETLLTVGRVLDRPELVDAARSLAERVTWRAIEERRFRLSAQGFEYRVYDPGFFRGLSGIGYQLLRLVDPDGLPTVLGFQQGVQCPRPSVVTNDVEGGARDGES